MNNNRRKSINKLYERLEDLKAELEEILEEEEEARANIPKSLQESERYEKAEEACENLGNAIYSLEESLEYMESATE